MKKKYTILASIILFFSLMAKSQTGTFVPELAKFDTAMLNLLNQYNIPGAQLAITYQGRMVYNRGFGYADTLTHTLVQPDNIFRIASVSKPVTAITILYLVEHGLLNLDDIVFGANGILNDAAYENVLDPNVYKITVRHLLTHSAGWNSNISGDPVFNTYNIANTMGVTPPAGPKTIISYVLSRQKLNFEPGTQFQYSNFGFCILGRVIEKITGENYENYVRNNILIPLEIETMDEGYNLLANQLPKEVVYYEYPGAAPTKSVYDNTTLVSWPYGGFNIECMDSNGGWVASAGDLCKLLCGIDGFSNVTDILSPETINLMMQPSAVTNSYTLGWNIDSHNNLWHRGSIQGTTTEMARGSNEISWALLTNYRNADATQLNSSIDNLVWNTVPKIKKWPVKDVSTSVEKQNSASVGIFPNPSHGKFTIRCSLPIISATIYNTKGQTVRFADAKTQSNIEVIDISDLPKGVYFVKVNNTDKIYTGKIIVE